MKFKYKLSKERSATLMALMVALGIELAPCCTEVEPLCEGQKLTKVFTISYGEGIRSELTKSSVNEATGELAWTGDTEQINYYTITGTTTRELKTVTTSSGTTTQVSVEYTLGDSDVIMLTKGASVGAVSTRTSTTWDVTNGVPPTQDGTIPSSLVSINKISLGSNSGALKCPQAFVSFSLPTATIGGAAIKKIKITDAGGGNVAGSVRYNVNGTYNTCTSGATAISMSSTTSIDATKPDKLYYFAVLPRTYSSGLRFTFLDNAGKEIGWAQTKSITPAEGTILPLGGLSGHKKVLPTAMEIMPNRSVHIVNTTNCKMTKKLYVKAVPADVTDIAWYSSDTGVATVAAGPDETIDGERYLTATVTPVAEPAWNAESSCTIYAYSSMKGTASGGSVTGCTNGVTVASRVVYVGHFVDMGGSLLWCAHNIQGSATTTGGALGKEKRGTLQLTTDVNVKGSYYAWGQVKESTGAMTDSGYMGRWTGQSTAYNYTWANPYGNNNCVLTGGKYKAGKTTLDQYDDVAQVMTQDLSGNLKMRMPRASELADLTGNRSLAKFYGLGGTLGVKMNSTVKFYEDLWLFIPYAGLKTFKGWNDAENFGWVVWSADCYNIHWPVAGSQSQHAFPGDNGVWYAPQAKSATADGYMGANWASEAISMSSWILHGASVRPVKALY